MLGVGNRKFSNSRADSRVLVRRFNVADQGGGAGFQAGDAPGRLELRRLGVRFTILLAKFLSIKNITGYGI